MGKVFCGLFGIFVGVITCLVIPFLGFFIIIGGLVEIYNGLMGND